MIINKNKHIRIGDRACITQQATREIINQYCKISGDYNPIHWDDSYANSTFFGGCIAHGLFCLGMVSKLIGMELPGTGTIFINEKLEYKKPVYVGDIITAIVEVVDIVESKRILEVYIILE